MSEAIRPTLEEIELAKQLQAEHEERRPRTSKEARKVIRGIYADWQAGKGTKKAAEDLLSYVEEVSKSADVTNEDRGEVRALWTWKSQPEGADREIPHRYLAQACGQTRGYQVLEDSPAGQQLDGYWLGEKIVRDTLVQSYNMKSQAIGDTVGKIWDDVSARYIEAAEGKVFVFAAEVGENSVLGGTELPRAMANEHVRREGLEFPIEFPHQAHLPTDMHELLAHPATRAELRREHYDLAKSTPEQFAAKLAAIEVPEHLKQAHTEAVARLSAAKDYSELTAPPVEPTGAGIAPREPAQAEPAKAEPQQPGPKQPELQEPAPSQPETKEPEPKQPAPTPPGPAQPEPKQPPLGHSFIHGGRVPTRMVVPPRPRPVASTHGAINPVIEAAPKSPGVEQ
ncbi:hypothetical protein ACFWG6_04060 [Streptomyces erythrochromogenes]|uniref:hypothetical protein n=1 Tax=Streptomyces erythrochromogenes TaxID=285574 RepID=UPI003639E345